MTGPVPVADDVVPLHDLAGFVRARGPALVRFAHGLCGDRALAEDLVQEALVRLVRRFGTRLEADRPEAYVRRVVVRELLQHRRRRSSGEVPSDVPDRPADGGPWTEPDERDIVWRMLAGLPAKQRAVLVLGYYEGLADDEIARLVGCTRVTVRSQRARAMAKLREHPALAALDLPATSRTATTRTTTTRTATTRTATTRTTTARTTTARTTTARTTTRTGEGR